MVLAEMELRETSIFPVPSLKLYQGCDERDVRGLPWQGWMVGATPVASVPAKTMLPLIVCKHDPLSSKPPFTLIFPILPLKESRPLKFCTTILPVCVDLALSTN